jgi:hypothetical protein
MNLIRGLLFDNLGLKLSAVLLAVLVYLHVYTERPARLMFAFPIQITDLDSTLALSGPVPSAVTAELRGTGKQLIRLRLAEPELKLSLAGVTRGHFQRALTDADLPLNPSDGLQVERMVGPRVIELQLDRRIRRQLPVAARLQGASGADWGAPLLTPSTVTVIGPEAAVAAMDSVVLGSVRVEGRRDTIRARVAPQMLPDWCVSDPPMVLVRVPLRRAGR